MLQKVNLILTIVMSLLVIAVIIQLRTSQRNVEESISALTTQLADFRADLQPEGTSSNADDSPMPPLFTREEIDDLSSSEIQTALLRVVNARNNRSMYSPAQVEEIDRQYEMMMARLRSSRGEDERP